MFIESVNVIIRANHFSPLDIISSILAVNFAFNDMTASPRKSPTFGSQTTRGGALHGALSLAFLVKIKYHVSILFTIKIQIPASLICFAIIFIIYSIFIQHSLLSY